MQNSPARASTTTEDASCLMSSLPALPIPSVHPVMIMLAGLPGTGKSYFARQIASLCPVVVLESDAMRKALFPQPTYLPHESARTFAALHHITEELLRQNVSVLIDATNLIDRNRKVFYNIADRCRAKLIMVATTAPSHVVRTRLEQRGRSNDREDNSDADWRVYWKMESSAESIRREHYMVDTSGDTQRVLYQVTLEANRWINDTSAKEEVWTSR